MRSNSLSYQIRMLTSSGCIYLFFKSVTVKVLSTCSLLQTAIVMDHPKVKEKAGRFMEKISEVA